MAIFEFGVNGEYPCVLSIRIYSSFKIVNEASECPGSTWHKSISENPPLDNANKKTIIISRWQMTVGLIFTLSLVSVNNKIARVDSTGK